MNCTFIATPETFNILFTEASLAKNFLFLKRFTGTFYSVSLIGSSAKQNTEQLYSNRYGDCCLVHCFPLGTINITLPVLENLI